MMTKRTQYQLTANSGLVLEGGGMRGVFTCGVLDCLMDRGVRFPYTIGVSAGACNGLSFMSRQRGRARYSNIDLIEAEGTLTVLRPERPIEVGRIECDTRKLVALYDEGYAVAEALKIIKE